MKLNLLAANLLQKIWIREDGLTCLSEQQALPQLEGYHLRVEGDSFVYTDAQGISTRGDFLIRNDEVILLIDGYSYGFTVVPEAAALQEDADSEVIAELPGRVIRLAVQKGARVEAGAPLVVLEAMKMEHTLRAKSNSEILEVLVSEGEQVQAGQILIILTPGKTF